MTAKKKRGIKEDEALTSLYERLPPAVPGALASRHKAAEKNGLIALAYYRAKDVEQKRAWKQIREAYISGYADGKAGKPPQF